MRLVVFFLGLIVPYGVWATTLPKVPIEDLYEAADEVVVVQIKKGELLKIDGYPCGAEYGAEVVERFKGEGADEINFGYYLRYEIGSKYLLFLTNPEQDYRPITSTSSAAMRAEAEHQRRCAEHMSNSRVMHSGVGALSIKSSIPYEFSDAVVVPLRFLGIPDEVERKPADLGERQELDDVVWVLEENLFSLLRHLQVDAAN